jgi:hypothetical protein
MTQLLIILISFKVEIQFQQFAHFFTHWMAQHLILQHHIHSVQGHLHFLHIQHIGKIIWMMKLNSNVHFILVEEQKQFYRQSWILIPAIVVCFLLRTIHPT